LSSLPRMFFVRSCIVLSLSMRFCSVVKSVSFFFHATVPPEIYTLSLHDALPIFSRRTRAGGDRCARPARDLLFRRSWRRSVEDQDRKSTRLNSSHQIISYAVFCLKKKKKTY